MRNIPLITIQALRLVTVSVLLFFGLSASADLGMDYVLCKNGKEVRTLRAAKNDETGKCETLYSKAGKDQVIGGGQNPSSCNDVVARVRKNLENGNWKCREVKQSTVSVVSDDIH